jgi:hypothetical protein
MDTGGLAMIEIRGVEALMGKLERLKKLEAVTAAMRAAALYLKGKLAKYPSQRSVSRASVYGAPFQSDRQRRWFFWALGAGEISVPYHRGEAASSERLGQSWTIEDKDMGFTQVIGNDTSYGSMVMGSYTQGEQSEFMHASGWTPYDETVDFYEPYIVDKLQEAIEKELED